LYLWVLQHLEVLTPSNVVSFCFAKTMKIPKHEFLFKPWKKKSGQNKTKKLPHIS